MPLNDAGEYVSKHVIEEIPHGFRVHCPDKPSVQVELDPYNLYFTVDTLPIRQRTYPFTPGSSVVYLPDFYRLSSCVVGRLNRDWQRPTGRHGFPMIHNWVEKQTGRAIGKKLHAQWLRLLQEADPLVLAVQKRVFSATTQGGDWLYLGKPNFYKHTRFVQDILKYRAAAIAAVYWDRLPAIIRNLPTVPDERTGFSQEDEVLEQIRANWLGMFSPDGQPYTSLNRTLMNLPGGVPGITVCELHRIRLPEPATNRLKLLAYSTCGAVRSVNGDNRVDEAIDAVRRSSPEQIRKAVRAMWRYQHEDKATFRSQKKIRSALFTAFDAQIPFTGTLVSIAERSIDWHRAEERVLAEERLRQQANAALWDTDPEEAERLWNERERVHAAERLARAAEFERRQEEEHRKLMAMSTKLPPVPLPEIEGVTFLATVKQMYEEGEHMHHCIANYASSAVAGNGFYFHVSYNGEEASVEVTKEGHVRQSYGPHDKLNTASEWGKKVLAKWGKVLNPNLIESKPQAPHRDNLRYEHYWLTREDIQRGYAVINGQRYAFEPGTREIAFVRADFQPHALRLDPIPEPAEDTVQVVNRVGGNWENLGLIPLTTL